MRNISYLSPIRFFIQLSCYTQWIVWILKTLPWERVNITYRILTVSSGFNFLCKIIIFNKTMLSFVIFGLSFAELQISDKLFQFIQFLLLLCWTLGPSYGISYNYRVRHKDSDTLFKSHRISWWKSSQFRKHIHLLLYRAFFWGIYIFPIGKLA